MLQLVLGGNSLSLLAYGLEARALRAAQPPRCRQLTENIRIRFSILSRIFHLTA